MMWICRIWFDYTLCLAAIVFYFAAIFLAALVLTPLMYGYRLACDRIERGGP